VADAAGAAIAAARSTSGSAMSAGIAGAFSFNTITGGVTAGVYNITDFTASGNATIEALAERGSGGSNIDTFSGGFAVSLNQSSGGNAGGVSLGLVVARNTITDPLTAKIKNVKGGADNTVTVGTLVINAKNDRKINANAAGGALTVTQSGGTSVSLAIAAVDGKNTISGDVTAAVELGDILLATTGNGISLDGSPTSLDILASDTAMIQVFSIAAAISIAQGSSNSISLSGGGAGAVNTISSKLLRLPPCAAAVRVATVSGLPPLKVQQHLRETAARSRRPLVPVLQEVRPLV